MFAMNLRKRFLTTVLTTTREKAAVINGDMSSIYQLFTYRNVLYGAKKVDKILHMPLGAGCRRFESCHSDQTKSSVNSFVCGTFSFIPAANVPMLGFAVFDFIRRNRDFQGHLGVLDVGLSVSSLLFAFRAGSISCLFRVSKRHLHRTLSDILTALVMIL